MVVEPNYHYWSIDISDADKRALQLYHDIPQGKQFLNIESRIKLTLGAWIRKQNNDPGGCLACLLLECLRIQYSAH